jgi:hypothetical protein
MHQNMLDFKEDGVQSFLVKLLKSKLGIVSWRPSKTLSKSESIPHTLLSLNIWSCKIQDWVIEATKAYEVTYNAEYKLNPQT